MFRPAVEGLFHRFIRSISRYVRSDTEEHPYPSNILDTISESHCVLDLFSKINTDIHLHLLKQLGFFSGICLPAIFN